MVLVDEYAPCISLFPVVVSHCFLFPQLVVSYTCIMHLHSLLTHALSHSLTPHAFTQPPTLITHVPIHSPPPPIGKGPVFQTLLMKVVNCLTDPELPVKVDACVALRAFLEPFDADDLQVLKPMLPKLLSDFFALMGEVRFDVLCVGG